jgi:hypothetical protein
MLLSFLLLHPGEATGAAREGLSLWLNTLLPTLLPFLITTGILLRIGVPFSCPDLIRRLSRVLFGLSPSGLYCLMLGLLCGYPMGAKLTSDFYDNGRISKCEAEYLLAISCNPSPAFLINYLAMEMLSGQIPIKQILTLTLMADLLCMVFFRFVVYGRTPTVPTGRSTCRPDRSISITSHHPLRDLFTKKETSTDPATLQGTTFGYDKSPGKLCPSEQSSPGAIVDVSIMNGFETITRLGGYILLFSILCAMLGHYWPFGDDALIVLSGFVELTSGLNRVAGSLFPLKTRFLLSMVMSCTGGLCVLFQTRSVLSRDLGILPYVSAKLFQGITLAIWILFLF